MLLTLRGLHHTCRLVDEYFYWMRFSTFVCLNMYTHVYKYTCKFMVEGDAQHPVVEDLLIAVTPRALAILKEIKSLISFDLIYVK